MVQPQGNTIWSSSIPTRRSETECTSTSVNAAATGNWEIITTADGNSFANFHQKANRELEAAGSNGNLIRWDFVTSAANRHITVTPSFTIQFEMIRTGQVDGNTVGVLGKIDDVSGYPLNTGIFTLNVMNNYPIGEAVQFTVNFGAKQNEDGSGTVYVYLYVNGVYQSANTVAKNLNKDEYAGFYWYALRLPIAENQTHSEVALDNMYIRGFNENVLGENGRLPDEYSQFARADHKKLALPDVALVDGDAVGYDEIDAKLNDGGNHTVELLHKPWRTLTVQSTSTIKTNGYTGVKVGDGYISSEANGVITVARDERTVKLNVIAGDKVIASIDDALYSVGHRALLDNLGNFYHNASVYFEDGKYYEVVWAETEKPEFAEEITYNVSLVEHDVIVVNTAANAVVADQLVYTDGVITDGLNPDFDAAFYFNEDVNSTSYLRNNNFANNITWELNGHTYNYTPIDENVHGFTTDATDKITVKNGTIKVNSGNAFIYAVNGTTPTATFEDVNFDYINANLTDWRGGTLNFEGCTFTNPHITLGARPTVDTYINLNDCTINTAEKVIFAYQNNDGFGYEAGSLANVDRHVRVTNSRIYMTNTVAALVSMPKENCINLAEGEVNNRLLYLANTTVYACTVYQGGSYEGTVSFGEGVKYAFGSYAEFDAGRVTAADGVQLGVKTNDMSIENLATANYATVIWAEGVVEYWADGSVPAAPAEYKNLAVGPVVAGNEYNFENTVGAATDFELTANLTLHSNVYYNFYVERAASVTINGQLIEGVNGRYSYELLPKYALGELHIVVVFDDGSVYSRTTNLMEYINKSAADTEYAYNAQLVQVYANMLQYFLDVQDYERMVLAQSAAKEFISTYNPVAAEEINAVISGNVNDYFESATFLLDGDVKLVITGKDGVALDGVTVTVGDYTATAIAVDGQLYVLLPAYLLTEAVDITVGDVTVQYSLGAYVNNAEESAVAVATSLYNYANAANLYEEVLNTTDAQ